MENHLAAIGRAIRDGYDVRGYFSWSLADNYEWHYGYKAFFGLARMDPKTFDRILKPSAHFFRKKIKANKTVGSVSTLKTLGGFVQSQPTPAP
jgi:beta-glucosidase